MTADLKSYSFIALVTIIDLAPVDLYSGPMHSRKNGMIKAKINELFKGKDTTEFTDPSFKSDCALPLQIGEQWLFFGFGNKAINVSACGYTVRYSNENGLRDWHHFSGISRLENLRKLYNHLPPANKTIQYYKNGNVEVNQHFKNGKLDGLRDIYYPDGHLFIEESFKNGERSKFRKVYLPLGQLIAYTRCTKGYVKKDVRYIDTADAAWFIRYRIAHAKDFLFIEPNHTSEYYATLLDSLKKLSHWERSVAAIKFYSDNGLSYSGVVKSFAGDVESIQHLDWRHQFYYGVNYKYDGNIDYTTQYNNLFNSSLEIAYKNNGSVERLEQKCDYCKFYFDKNNPVGKPQPVYVQ